MIKKLKLKNFTVFGEADFDFARGLNVIIGVNGTGKSHVLKLAYSNLSTLAEGGKDKHRPEPTKSYLQDALAKKYAAFSYRMIWAVWPPDSQDEIVVKSTAALQLGI